MVRDPELPRFAGLNALALEGWQCGSGLRSRAVRTWFPSQHPMKVLHFVRELRGPTPGGFGHRRCPQDACMGARLRGHDVVLGTPATTRRQRATWARTGRAAG